jgi:hypothetical protein
VNVAHPLALLSDEISSDIICQNVVPAIRHLTGTSVRNVVESRRAVPPRDATVRVIEFEDMFRKMKPAQRLGAISKLDVF